MKKITFEHHTLYHFSSCMFCLKVRIYLFFLGVKLARRDILMNPNYAKELIEGGGKRQVPCLRINQKNGDVNWIYESTAIIDYFKQQIANR